MSKEFEEMSNKGKSIYFMSNPEWYHLKDSFAEEPGFPELTDKATPLAVESYNFAKTRYEESLRTGIIRD